MSVFDPPLTFINNDEDNYQQATDSDGTNDNNNNNNGLLSNLNNKSLYNKNGKNSKDNNNNNNDKDDNDNDNESSKTSVLTRTKSISHHIRWEIDDRSIQIAKLATKADKRGVIEATVIKEGYDFKLELCASGWRSSQDGYCAFYLTVPNMTDTFVARYRVQFGSTSRVSSIRHDFQLGVGFPNFCHQDTLDSCLDNKVCIFNIVIEIFNCESTIKLPLTPLSVKQPDYVLAQLMRQIYNNRLHCDVKLICHGKIIKAHKVILSHASPVFKAMFTHNLYENNRNEVNMLEWDPCIVEAFIKYLYTAKIDIRTDRYSKQFKKSNRSNRSSNGLIKSSSYPIDAISLSGHSGNQVSSNNNNYFKPHSSFYTASTKSSKNNLKNDNDNNNDGMNSNNTSILGLDESGIDESKTWGYNELFEKKDNSLIPQEEQSSNETDSDVSSDISSDNSDDSDESDSCSDSSEDSDMECEYSDESCESSSVESLSDLNKKDNNNNNIDEKEEEENERAMVIDNNNNDNDNDSENNEEGERYENIASSDKNDDELDEMEIDKNDDERLNSNDSDENVDEDKRKEKKGIKENKKKKKNDKYK